jgi:hypothetical protein
MAEPPVVFSCDYPNARIGGGGRSKGKQSKQAGSQGDVGFGGGTATQPGYYSGARTDIINAHADLRAALDMLVKAAHLPVPDVDRDV